MRFGIDFGTTRTLVAAVDRGNYPVVGVEDNNGDPCEHIPSVVALDGDRLVCGWDAVAVGAAQGRLVRSFKRMLSSPGVTGSTPVVVGERDFPLGEVLETFARHIVEAIRHSQFAPRNGEPIEVMIGVPANAHSAQRLLTMDAFSRAGVEVLGLVNEPSAGAIEYTHRHPKGLNSRRTSVIIYDLGGGTFDASLVRIEGKDHEIVRSLGVPRLGGDDFDDVLADLGLAALGRQDDVLGARARQRVVDEARSAKERLLPQSRRIVLEIGDEDATIPVKDFYDAAAPLVQQSIDAMRPLIGEDANATLANTDIAGIYLVGGASTLPLVPRMLRKEFGRRVHRAPYPSASTAIGLAIAADPNSNYRLQDRFGRGIGVFREFDRGREVSFDPLVSPDAAMHAGGTVAVERRYRAAHNVGWFRFVEYSALSEADESVGDVTPIAEIVVPFDPALRDGRDLKEVPVERRDWGPEVIETVRIDGNGIASIRLELLEDGYVVERSVSL